MEPDPQLTDKTNSVLRALAREDRFTTAGELHLGMRRTGEAIGLVTVYRALRALEVLRLVDAVVDEDGRHRYRCCSTHPHQHLVCSACRSTVEIPVYASPFAEWDSPESSGFSDVVVRVEISGVCPRCSGRGRTPVEHTDN